MIGCYIIYSEVIDKFYIGITQGVEERLYKHNTAKYGNHFTSQANDWKVFILIDCSSIMQAMKIEKHLKR